MQKEKQLIPQLRFSEFEGVWEENKLGNIASFFKGKGISKSDILEDGKNECIRYGELYTTYNEVITSITSKTNISLDISILSEENDVIIPSSGETQLDIATASCVLKSGVILGGDLNIIKSQLNGVFLSYLLNNSKKKDIAKLAQGNSVVHLYNKQLGTLKINIPSLKEQQKIANFLTSIDNQIQALKKKKSLLEQYKKGILQKIFKQELRFKDEDGNAFPEWKEKKLGDILVEVNEKTTVSNQYTILSSTAKGLFNQSDYFTRDIASKDNTGYKILRKEQLVFSPQNLWLGNINVNCDFEVGIVSPSYKVFEFNVKLTSFNFCKYLLFTNRMFYEYAQASEQGASVVRRNLDMSSFKAIPIKLPSIKEQSKIANFLSTIDENIELVNTKIEHTKAYKKGLLQQMFV
tara:strand:+ start:22707 stop:23927 length:1221 start_codon:yes stop_codon:yes gene_type:complete